MPDDPLIMAMLDQIIRTMVPQWVGRENVGVEEAEEPVNNLYRPDPGFDDLQ